MRARVDGIVQKRLFTEGADIRQGQALFQIDPAPYRAALQRARAQLASAEASATSATLLAERYARLIQKHAISQQDYDNAIAQRRRSAADVDAARAAVETAEINLGYTRVDSPISGRTGRSNVTEGAYVQQAQATLLTTVTQLDPIYADTAWPTIDLLRVRRAIEAGQLVTIQGKLRVTLVLEDGREYPRPGALLVTGVNVEQTTGSVPLRALVPNPEACSCPGCTCASASRRGPTRTRCSCRSARSPAIAAATRPRSSSTGPARCRRGGSRPSARSATRGRSPRASRPAITSSSRGSSA